MILAASPKTSALAGAGARQEVVAGRGAQSWDTGSFRAKSLAGLVSSVGDG